jgi:ER lumen protein retaining receptor
MHLASIFVILLKIYTQKNCKGISLKTQALYLLVFITRYIDLYYNFSSMYNWLMKLVFIVSSAAIVFLMKFRKPYSDTYDAKQDSFNVLYLIAPCAVLALLINEYFALVEIMWTFSIYLEAVAIIPQIMVVHEAAKTTGGFVENLTSHYVFTLGAYRALYLLNWVYRIFTEDGYRNWIVWIAGLVQTAIYCDFFYYYVTAQWAGKQVVLPI